MEQPTTPLPSSEPAPLVPSVAPEGSSGLVEKPSSTEPSGPGGSKEPSGASFPDQIVLILGGVILVILAQLLRSKSYTESVEPLPLALTLVGMLFFVLGLQEKTAVLRLSKLNPILDWLNRQNGYKPLQTMLLLLSVCCLVVVIPAAGLEGKMNDPLAAVGSWIMAICFIFLGSRKSGEKFPAVPWRALAWAAGLFLLALPLRAVDTAHFPVQLSGDEASVGLGALGFLKGSWNNIFNVNWFSFPSLFFLLPAAFIQMFGHVTEALRLPAALGGSLTVAAVYLLGRQLYNHRTGLFAALLLAGLHFHIHFSRVGLNNIWDGLFYVLVPLAFWRGWHTGRRSLLLLAGLLLGLSQYFYVTTRVLPLLVLVWIAYLGWRDRATFKRLRASLALMFWMFFVVFAPLAWFYLQRPAEYMAPLQRVSLFSGVDFGALGLNGWLDFLANILTQILNSFRGFTDLATRAWYTSGSPVLRPFYAAFFILGIMLLLRQWKDSRTWMLISWVACIGLVGGFSESTPAAQRYVAVTPAAVLVAGYCLAEIATRLAKTWPNRQRWVFNGFLALVVIFAIGDISFYFNEYTPESLNFDRNTRTAQRLADYLHDKQGNWQVLFYGWPVMGYYSIASISYLEPQIIGTEAIHPWGSPENPLPSSENVIFVFLPGHADDLDGALRQYPGGRERDIVDPTMGQLFTLYELSPFHPSH